MVLSNKEWLDKMDEIISAIQNGGSDSQVIKDMLSNMWISSATYNVGDYVLYNNNIWKCLVQNSNITPSEGTTWTRINITSEISTLNSNLGNIGNISILMQSGYDTGNNVDILDLSQYRMITFIAVWDNAQFMNMYTIPYSVFMSFIGGVMILKATNDYTIEIRPVDNTHINLKCNSPYLTLRVYGIK